VSRLRGKRDRGELSKRVATYFVATPQEIRAPPLPAGSAAVDDRRAQLSRTGHPGGASNRPTTNLSSLSLRWERGRISAAPSFSVHHSRGAFVSAFPSPLTMMQATSGKVFRSARRNLMPPRRHRSLMFLSDSEACAGSLQPDGHRAFPAQTVTDCGMSSRNESSSINETASAFCVLHRARGAPARLLF
jgi:hypothetical protein